MPRPSTRPVTRPTLEFLRAIASVTALCTVVGLVGFALSIIVKSEGPQFVDPSTKLRISIAFDGFMWAWIAGPMFILHLRVKYRTLYNFWQMRAASTLGLLFLVCGHGMWLIYPESELFNVITTFVDFLLINVVPLIVGKWLVVRESKKPSTAPSAGSLPDQYKHSTMMFPCIIFALMSYGASLPMTVQAIKAICLFMVLGTGAISCIVALKYRFQLKGHFDYVLMLWCAYHVAPVARSAIYAVPKSDATSSIVVIYGYRGVLSMFVIMFDDLMEATFGQWPQSLWGTYFLRLIESLVSLTMALNTLNDNDAVLTYVAANVLITTLKDSGLQDDIRYLMMNGYFIWAPVKRFFPCSSNEPRSALESMCSLPSVAPTSTDIAASNSDNRPASSTPPPVPAVGCAKQTAAPSLLSWWFPPKVVKQATPDHIKALSVDLGIQIERSELTLMSRVSSFVCVAACYCLVQLWQRTSTSHLLLQQEDSKKIAATMLLVLTLAELVVSRALAVVIMNRKIRRLHKLMRVTGVTAESLQLHRQGSPPGGGAESANAKASPVLVVPTRWDTIQQSANLASGMMAESASLASIQRILPPLGGNPESQHVRKGGPRPPLLHAMWSTGLPRQKSFEQLVFALIVFTSFLHFGPW